MGFFLTSIMVVGIIVFSYFGFFSTSSQIRVENERSKLFSDTAPINYAIYNSDYFASEEVEKALIKGCLLSQSYILRCRECYATGKTNCPYPTDSFCRSVVSNKVSAEDVSVVWSFLPSSSGKLEDIFRASKINPKAMTDVAQLPAAIRWIVNHDVDHSIASGLTYRRPSGDSAAPCAVEGVVGNVPKSSSSASH